MRGGIRRALAGAAAILSAFAWALAAAAAPVRVSITTEAGPLVIEVYPDAAPVTASNFLAYVDGGRLVGAAFYRTVTAANDHNPARIQVIQGGLQDAPGGLSPIVHETTEVTGLHHGDGVVSMARDAPGTASSEFFICIGDQPALDFGGARNPDGQGFAAFGRVVSGMEVVKAIHDAPTRPAGGGEAYTAGQILAAPVKILAVQRLPEPNVR